MPASERSRLSGLVTERFLSLPEVRSARSLFAFWSFGSEVSTTGLIEALDDRGVRVALPRIADGDLEAVSYRPGDPATEAAFGALEPAGDACVDPTSIDVVATPARRVRPPREAGRVRRWVLRSVPAAHEAGHGEDRARVRRASASGRRVVAGGPCRPERRCHRDRGGNDPVSSGAVMSCARPGPWRATLRLEQPFNRLVEPRSTAPACGRRQGGRHRCRAGRPRSMRSPRRRPPGSWRRPGGCGSRTTATSTPSTGPCAKVSACGTSRR